MLGSPAGPGGAPQRGLWPLAPAPAPTATTFSTDGISKYGVYSLFPGGPTFGSALYSHASTIGRFASGHIQQSSSGNAFHHAAHKVSDSLFSATGYTFGAPTPPPGSPYSPIPVTQLELLTKGYSTNNIIIQQSQDYHPASPKKVQITEKRCDEKCCSIQKTQKSCLCPMSPVKKITEISASGCSRTNPIEWTGVNVKKEPGTPCQVAEITTSMSPVVKLEVTSPTQKTGGDLSGSMMANNGAQIPVGIAVARQRVQQHELVASPSVPPAGLLATVGSGGGGATIKELDNAAAISSMAAGSPAAGGGPILQCTEDRGLAAFQIGGGHGQAALATPTLWQYPAPVPMEPMVPLPVPTMPPVGFQLVRDPTTGGLLLLPTTTGIEPLQQTVVWPSYPQTSSVLLPSLSSMQPPPLQLLSSASSDYLSSSTTLHQHTQTHSTRLVAVTTDAKRKMLPATTLIKIETDGTTLDQAKALQAVSTIASNNSTVFTDQTVQPLVTTHVIYQHPTTNLIVSQTPMSNNDSSTTCRSQATSPVTSCLTPPPDSVQIQEEEMVVNTASNVQDANIQTDTPICSEDDNSTYTMCDVIAEEKPKEVMTIESEKVLEEVREEGRVTITELPEEAVLTEQDKPKPDLSGLELLSNSIVEFENHRTEPVVATEQGTASSHTEDSSNTSPEDSIEEAKEVQPVVLDDNLGGLDLLCALAEQRILEENIEKPEKKERSTKHHKDRERRREKRKSKKHSSDEPKRKKMKHRSKEREHRKRSDKTLKKTEPACACNYKHYKTPQSEQEVKKFLESKAPPSYCCQGDWPCMNAIELDMRMKLAELQREYKEKQKELSKLKPKKHHHSDCTKKAHKKSERSDTPPPPHLDKISENDPRNREDLLKPPKLSAMPKLAELKRRASETDSSPEKTSSSSSKKRKVGRPKRIMTPLGEIVGTETIVAKKLKNNFVNCLLAAKEKIKQKNHGDTTPPRFIEEPYTHKLKKVKNNNNNNNTIVIMDEESKSSKMRPKLRAEATVKVQEDDDEVIDHIDEDIDEVNTSNESFSEGLLHDSSISSRTEESSLEVEEEVARVDDDDDEEEEATGGKEEMPNLCALTEDLLGTDKLRVLTAMGGLFYAGRLNAVEPPDVYSITLDGERGNRPHIMSREEILRDAIVEVSPKTTEDLPAGTRLCAYWSQQYRCLYPGSAAEPGTPDPQLDGKFVSVEFDDGDSGRIALQDIRLLPPNYPIMEYDPNPLLSLCKRRRRTSTSISTEEKQLQETLAPILEVPKKPVVDPLEHHKEKKRLKKKKKEKIKEKLLKSGDDKKKKRKHKCADEFCKHKRHHKKHKKHRRHHDKSKTDSEESSGRPEFICEIISGETEVGNAVEASTVQTVGEEDNDESSQQSVDDFPNYEAPANPDDEVTMDDILEATGEKKSKKFRDRQESCESRSKMSAFLPARQLWHWAGKGYKRPRAKGKSKKCFYKAIERGKESITVGDAAVFLSTGRPDRPYIGRIEAMWEMCGTMAVKVKWFYHPEETVGCPANLQYPGALFESPHIDENDVQTISHKCEVLPLKDYVKRLGNDPARYATIYDNNDIYYLAGHYDPTVHTLRMESGIPFSSKSD
ncbi:protein winged eye isoform X2 [Anthonomus grandis grandis]|uniref:protein winged eye isoform X2 n=1 Tax=Anthonomus grandis grandis TaxID=2921223 RepID=UPI002165D8C2|nr:protein winged eye isoform X2 [Anthonomus grandis grandis]